MPNTKTSKKQSHPIYQIGPSSDNKLAPQAIELEELVIGGLLLEKEAFSIISDLLRPDSFYLPKHNYIYEAMQSLAAQDLPIDIYTVAEKLKSQGTYDEAGGAEYLSQLNSRVASTAHLRYHAQIVAQKATARELLKMAYTIEELAYDETQDIEDLMNKAEADIFKIAEQNQKRDVIQIDTVISEAFERMNIASKREGSISGIPSGFRELDKITSGWQKSDLVIIAARPAMGKTAFVLSMAKNIAVNYQTPIAIFSLEMSKVQLVNRLIMNVCELNGDKIKTGKLTRSERDRLEHKIQDLYGAPLFLDDTPGLTIFEFRSKARKLVREKKVQMIIIDYLQLMSAEGMSYGSREQEVSIISRSLKGLAKELDIPIIALSQLNRSVETRNGTGIEGKKPQLSDLRESGAIEQDADMVCFIHRPEYYHIYTDDAGKDLHGFGQIIVAKHRNGATGELWLRFIKEYTRFQDDDAPVNTYDDDAMGPQEQVVQSRMNHTQSPDSASLGDAPNNMPF